MKQIQTRKLGLLRLVASLHQPGFNLASDWLQLGSIFTDAKPDAAFFSAVEREILQIYRYTKQQIHSTHLVADFEHFSVILGVRVNHDGVRISVNDFVVELLDQISGVH